MSKDDTHEKAMDIINEHQTLIPGTNEHELAAGNVASLIDELGQERALEQVRKAKSILKNQHAGTDI